MLTLSSSKMPLAEIWLPVGHGIDGCRHAFQAEGVAVYEHSLWTLKRSPYRALMLTARSWVSFAVCLWHHRRSLEDQHRALHLGIVGDDDGRHIFAGGVDLIAENSILPFLRPSCLPPARRAMHKTCQMR